MKRETESENIATETAVIRYEIETGSYEALSLLPNSIKDCRQKYFDAKLFPLIVLRFELHSPESSRHWSETLECQERE